MADLPVTIGELMQMLTMSLDNGASLDTAIKLRQGADSVFLTGYHYHEISGVSLF